MPSEPSGTLAMRMRFLPSLGAGLTDFRRNLRRSGILSLAPQRGLEVLVQRRNPSSSDSLSQSTLKPCVQEQGCCGETAPAFCVQCPLGLNSSHVLGRQNSIWHASQNCNILWVSSRCLKRCQMAHKRQTSFEENVPHFLGYEPQI